MLKVVAEVVFLTVAIQTPKIIKIKKASWISELKIDEKAKSAATITKTEINKWQFDNMDIYDLIDERYPFSKVVPAPF